MSLNPSPPPDVDLLNARPIRMVSARKSVLVIAGALALAILLILLLLWEGEPDELLGQLQTGVESLLRAFGRPAAFALLYVEESGVPLPVPGDVYVLYVGHRAAGQPLVWFASWLGLIACVVLGASNLYLVARRYGRRLAVSRLGQLLHLTEARLDQGELWFARWGIWAVIFGRHLPGMRIPITVAAGVLGVPYRVFVGGVAISTAIWAGFFMLVGQAFGDELQTALQFHRGQLVLGGGALLVLLLTALVLRRRLATRVAARGTGQTR